MRPASINLPLGFSRILLLTVTVLAVTTSFADSSSVTDSPKLVCEPILDWQTLSIALQTQINLLETEGVENLADDEFEHYAKLADSLLTVKKLQTRHYDVLIAAEKRKQVEQEKAMAAERAETADIEKTDQKIKELEDALSD